jgi:MFS family permease
MNISNSNTEPTTRAASRHLVNDATTSEPILTIESRPVRLLTWGNYRTLTLSALGGALEYYDFVIFAFLAPALGQLFFPRETPDWLRLLQTFGVFAVGYLVRPLGGILIAHLGDLFGRKRMFTVTILMMAAATLGTGLLPVYSQVGALAPLALILLRLVQGAALGGEVPGAWVFVSEHVPTNRIGLACGTLSAGISVGILLGSGTAATLATVLTTTEMSDWGWRIPFLLGGLLGLGSVYLRGLLQETPIFKELRAQKLLAAELPLKIAIRDHIRSVALSVVLTTYLSATIIVTILLTPALLQKLDGISMAVATWANSAATLSLTIGCIIGGAIADRFGAGRVLILGSILLGCSSWLFYTKGIATSTALLPLYSSTGFLVGIAGGVHPYVMVRAFPAAIRFSGLSFSYNIANAVFAGLTPLLISLLLPKIHLVHLYYVLGACAIGCAAGVGLLRGDRSVSARLT